MTETTQATEIKVDRYIAVTPGNGISGWYGVGYTVEEAKANLKRVGGNLNKVAIFRLPEGVHSAYVSGFGQIHWTWVSDEFRDSWDGGDLEVVHRRGVKSEQ